MAAPSLTSLEVAWGQTFPGLVNQLLNPQSPLARSYPHLHNNYRCRLEAAFIARGDHPISHCSHTVFDDYDAQCRSDELEFQENEDTRLIERIAPEADSSQTRAHVICPDLDSRVQIYGIAGTGTFGTVYMACERPQVASDPNNLKHFAIKVEKHRTMLANFVRKRPDQPMVMVLEKSKELRFIPAEAFIMLLLTTSNRFANLDSVYIHDRFQAIVMSPCVDYSADLGPIASGSFRRRFLPFSGRYLMEPDGTPLLDEMQACKVASQLLEAVLELADLHLWHSDLSINNFLVDQELNVTLIDLGIVDFGLEDKDFVHSQRVYVPFQEHQMSPELANALSVQGWFEAHPWDTHDQRQVVLWKLGVLIFGILHGYWPWDDHENAKFDLLDFTKLPHQLSRVMKRRANMMYDPLPLNENLSQDCKDVLRAMLANDPRDRPSLEQLANSYPWFLQWTYVERVWKRPFSMAFYNDSYQ